MFLAANLKRWRRRTPGRWPCNWRGAGRGSEEFEALCEKYSDVCLRCGDGDAPLTPDHVIPLSLRDSNRIANIQPLCGECDSWRNVEGVDCRRGVVPLEATRNDPTHAPE